MSGMPAFNGGAAQKKVAAGSVFAAGPVASVSVTFPAGRFAVAPIVTATCTASANVALVPNLSGVTTSGFTAYLYGVGGSWTSGSLSVYWIAMDAQ